jgi:hypothetical protein
MMKFLVVIVVLSAAYTFSAAAQDTPSCEQVRDGVWICDPPQRPTPLPTCKVFGGYRVCTGPLEAGREPANCGWRRRDYVCR